MNRRPMPVTEDDLHALVDGQLPPERRPQVMAYLARNPQAAANVAAWQFQLESMRSLFAEGEEAGADPAWGAEAKALAARRDGAGQGWLAGAARGAMGMAAAVALLVTGIFSVAAMSNSAPANIQDFTHTAQQAHADTVAGGVPSPAQPIRQTAWQAPDLTPIGWRLAGGRPVPVGGDGAAQFLYLDKSGTKRVSLMVRPPLRGERSAFSYVRDGKTLMFTWLDERFAYALVGDLSGREMLRLADAVHESLERAPRPAPAPSFMRTAMDWRL